MRRRPQVTIDVVAAEAGVSASTVSHVLNGRSDAARISVATSQRVREAASRLGYMPNHAARSLRRQRTGIISVLAWRLSSPFFADMAAGVRNVADAHGFQVGVIDAGALDRDVEIRALQHLRTGISDGVVVATSTHNRGGAATEALLELAAAGIPVSLVLDRSPGSNIPALDVDHAGGGYLAAQHLLSLGHRRIAHFTFADATLEPNSPMSQAARYWGYRRALAEAGVDADPAWLFRGPREIEGGRLMAHEFAARFPDPATRPTAVAAFNDRTAIGVIRGFYEEGIRVPEDVALIGFHDIPTARYTTPALTSIGHPLIELGEMAATSLFTLLDGGEVEQLDRTIPVSLIVRESCGAHARPAFVAPVPNTGAESPTLVGEPHA
ncbi:MAG: LacI family DNA-binding transcriptional regulator [Chloroflexota bacterium]